MSEKLPDGPNNLEYSLIDESIRKLELYTDSLEKRRAQIEIQLKDIEREVSFYKNENNEIYSDLISALLYVLGALTEELGTIDNLVNKVKETVGKMRKESAQITDSLTKIKIDSIN